MALIPATILTGFLGSGKTTLLKRVLTEAHGQKIAVIENEFGDENIDNEILVQDTKEQIIQLNNGCVCCTIREDLRTLLRPAVFVPESKGLNDLLRDFRSNRNHLAIVIDEFGSTAGLITIEDVLEEIERVAGDAAIEAVNDVFGVQLPIGDFDTIGGLVAHELGHVPRRGEATQVGPLMFSVMLTRGGAVRWFKVTRAPEEALGSDGA